MAGKKGRSGRRKSINTLMTEAMDNVDQTLPELFKVLIKKARDGDKDCLIYLIDRRLGKPKLSVDTSLEMKVSVTGEDMLRVIEEAKASLAAKLNKPVIRVLPPGSVTIQDITGD